MNIALLLTHPAPYREPVVTKLKHIFGASLTVCSLFGEDFGHSELGLGVERKPLISSKTQYLHGWSAFIACSRLVTKFGLSRRFDFVIWPAYAPWWLTIPILIRTLLGKKFAVCLDTTRDSGGWWSRKIKGLIFKRPQFLWVPGVASKRYLHDGYSVSNDKVVEGLYLPRFSIGKAARVKDDKPVFLMVANNLPYRQMHILALGFKQYFANGGAGQLIFCGKRSSELRGEGIETIDGLQWTELPALYAKADVYVHTGNEQFSTALLMGAMAGLPLMVSKDVGACADMFGDDSEEYPGLMVNEWHSVKAWQNAFEHIVAERAQWNRMGEIAKMRAVKFDVDAIVTRISELIA